MRKVRIKPKAFASVDAHRAGEGLSYSCFAFGYVNTVFGEVPSLSCGKLSCELMQRIQLWLNSRDKRMQRLTSRAKLLSTSAKAGRDSKLEKQVGTREVSFRFMHLLFAITNFKSWMA